MVNSAIQILLLFIFYFVLMLSYNIFSINKKNVDYLYQDKRKDKLQKIILTELKENKKRNSRKIFNKLKKCRYLLLFNNCLLNDEYITKDFKYADVINRFEDTFNNLSIYYMKKDNLSRNYYAYSLSLYKIINNPSYSCLFEILTKGDFEGLHNAFNTICIYSELDKLAAAINIINNKENGFNIDLITKFLLRFEGNKEELANILTKRFFTYNLNMQLVILKYFINIKFNSGDIFIKLLKNKNTERDLILELIKYYKIIINNNVVEILHNIVESSKDTEYVVSAINTLSVYPSSKTTLVLREKINNKNYLISYQAIRTLLILDGYDEYDENFETTFQKTIEYIKDKRS